MVEKRQQKEHILNKARTRLSAIKFLTLCTLLSGGIMLSSFVYSLLAPVNADIQLSPAEYTPGSSSWLLVLTSLILLVSLLTNFILYTSLKKLSDALFISNQNISNLKKDQSAFHEDDIKEIVTTRDLLLYKLIGSNKAKK